MAPTAQQLSSQWMSEAEKETESDRLIRKSKQSPFIPIGELSNLCLPGVHRCSSENFSLFKLAKYFYVCDFCKNMSTYSNRKSTMEILTSRRKNLSLKCTAGCITKCVAILIEAKYFELLEYGVKYLLDYWGVCFGKKIPSFRAMGNETCKCVRAAMPHAEV